MQNSMVEAIKVTMVERSSRVAGLQRLNQAFLVELRWQCR